MDAEPKLSGTVVVIRDGSEGLEVLLLERTRAPGTWVFPGGRVEEEDLQGSGAGDEEIARRAAIREAQEEASLQLPRPELLPISRWVTPPISAKRFDTWFFLARVSPDVEVQVDGAEMCDHRWLVPEAAMQARHRGEMGLAPPTFVTVSWLAGHGLAQDAQRTLAASPVLTFRPRICSVPDGACMLYPGDAGYEDGAVDRPGSRHRLWTLPDGWRYERS
jgi:8-oxo-dGTP pyrophosphatase MutT (NUDIX family)